MPNARQTSLIASPSSSRATNRRRSSITEHSFHGIYASPKTGKGVTHVSGTICHLCLGPLTVANCQGCRPPRAVAPQLHAPPFIRRVRGGPRQRAGAGGSALGVAPTAEGDRGR